MPANEIDLFKYGQLTQKVADMEAKIDAMQKSVNTLVAMADKSKGALWVGMTLAATFSSMVGFFIALFFHKGG